MKCKQNNFEGIIQVKCHIKMNAFSMNFTFYSCFMNKAQCEGEKHLHTLSYP